MTIRQINQLLQKAATLLRIDEDEFDVSTREKYLRRRRYGWISRVLNSTGPQTEDRLVVKTTATAEDKLLSKAHIVDYPHPFFSGETTSWIFKLNSEFEAFWLKLRTDLIKAIKTSRNQSQLDSFLKTTWRQVDKDKQISVWEYARKIKLDANRLFIAGSGTDVFFIARQLLAPDSLVSTTQENGSDIIDFVGKNNLVQLRYDQGNHFNQQLNHQQIYQGFVKDIQEGKRLISFTLCTKTGLRLDLPSGNSRSVLDLLSDYINLHNQKNPHDPVIILADAVQLGGRIPLSKLIKIITKPPFAGGFHSCSKFAGGVPHIGILILSNIGAKLISSNHSTITPKIAVKYQLVFAPAGYHTSKDLLASIRVRDNINSLFKAETIISHPQYSVTIKKLRQTYQKTFSNCGFHVLTNDTPTIITVEPPFGPGGITLENEKIFLFELAKLGISMGGFLKEGVRPKLRFGISIKLVEEILSGKLDLTGPQFASLQHKFLKNIQKALVAASEHVNSILGGATIFQKEVIAAKKILKVLNRHQKEIFINDGLPYSYEEIVRINKKIINLIKEFPLELIPKNGRWRPRSIASSIAITALFMDRAKNNKIPIATWWSGKDGISLAVTLQAARLASLQSKDFSIYVADTPFIVEETRQAFRQAIKMGVNLKRVASLPKDTELKTLYPDWKTVGSTDSEKVISLVGATSISQAKKIIQQQVVVHEGEEALSFFGRLLTEDDYDTLYKNQWRQPDSALYEEIMRRAKELPTTYIMNKLKKIAGGQVEVIRGVRARNGIYKNCLPLASGGLYTYIFPLVDIDEKTLEKYKTILSKTGLDDSWIYIDPSRARDAWVIKKNGKLVLAKPEDKGAVQKQVIIYPSGKIFESGKTSCAMDDQFSINIFAHKYPVIFPELCP